MPVLPSGERFPWKGFVFPEVFTIPRLPIVVSRLDPLFWLTSDDLPPEETSDDLPPEEISDDLPPEETECRLPINDLPLLLTSGLPMFLPTSELPLMRFTSDVPLELFKSPTGFELPKSGLPMVPDFKFASVCPTAPWLTNGRNDWAWFIVERAAEKAEPAEREPIDFAPLKAFTMPRTAPKPGSAQTGVAVNETIVIRTRSIFKDVRMTNSFTLRGDVGNNVSPNATRISVGESEESR
jgi:hypothetical protein